MKSRPPLFAYLLVGAASLLGGATYALADSGPSCPASSTSGQYSGTSQGQGNCGVGCFIFEDQCYKVRCFKCGIPDYVYGQECATAIDSQQECLGC